MNIMDTKETHWSRFATDFEERNNYVVGKAESELMLRKVAEQKELGRTLELACGGGTYSRVLAKEAELLYATDLSDEMLAVARAKLQSLPNVRLEKADCFHLAYEDNSFDTVFMANLLHIIPGPENAVAEAKRVLRKNGRMIAVSFTLEGMTLSNKLRMGYRYLRTYGKPPSGGRKLTVRDACLIMESQGLTVTKAELIGNNMKAVFAIARNNG
jgi:ubiquinone/menaquinone biosynthesis C-methylase UbiE